MSHLLAPRPPLENNGHAIQRSPIIVSEYTTCDGDAVWHTQLREVRRETVLLHDVILCVGDSNTWGLENDGREDRFPPEVRWPTRLATVLTGFCPRPMITGKAYEPCPAKYGIVETGVNGRTTDRDRVGRPGSNLRVDLPQILRESDPSVVAMMIGTNDTNTEIYRTAEEIGLATSGLIGIIRSFGELRGQQPKIILIAPSVINPWAIDFRGLNLGEYFDQQSVYESRKLVNVLQKLSNAHDTYFVNANSADINIVTPTGKDGLHITAREHGAIAIRLAEIITGHYGCFADIRTYTPSNQQNRTLAENG